MHTIKHDLRHALQDANYAEKHTNPGLIGWIHLGELNYADLRDQSGPQHKHLAEVLLQRGKCGVGEYKAAVRQFFMNLACSDPGAKHEKQKTQIRVPNDALRVAAIMLDPTYRNGCAEWMSNLKSKDFLNQSTSPRTALVEKMVKDFNNPNYVARSPAKAELVQSKLTTKLDPNDVSTLPQCYHGQVFTNQVCIFLFVALPY